MSTTFLKIKLKHLAEEVRIIKREESKYKGPRWGQSWARVSLMVHRLYTVRPEIRDAHLAYGYLRGKERVQIESSATTEPNWENVLRIVKKYGTRKQAEQFEEWRNPVAKAA